VDEAEWLACQEPQDLLAWLWLCGKASHRKLRLFAVACGRHIRQVFTQDSGDLMERVLEVNERYADGLAADGEVDEASRVAAGIAWEYDGDPGDCYAIFHAGECGGEGLPNRDCAARAIEWAVEAAESLALPWDPGAVRRLAGTRTDAEDWYLSLPRNAGVVRRLAERSALSVLLRDIFGNPFRPSPPLPAEVLAWNDGTVVRLARAMYEARDFRNMGVLADALLDAGCADEELLAHCRGGGEHVRGCWAVDALLGKG
jgi:hypothetical protein